MPLLFYSKSVDALISYDLIEDPALTVPMKLTDQGILYVRSMFIEETRSYSYFDPSACSAIMSGSYAIDTFNCYNIGNASFLPEAGSGWDGLYDISENYSKTVAIETFLEYTSGSVTGININGGTGWNNTGSIETNA